MSFVDVMSVLQSAKRPATLSFKLLSELEQLKINQVYRCYAMSTNSITLSFLLVRVCVMY